MKTITFDETKYQLVPIEPTEEMIDAVTTNIRHDQRFESWRNDRRRIYIGMLRAANKRCSSCDGTGDIHRADGEYLGECSCGASADKP